VIIVLAVRNDGMDQRAGSHDIGPVERNMWQLPLGTEITLRAAVPYPKAILCSEFVSGSEPTLIRLRTDPTQIDIVYACAIVMTRVPQDTKFLFVTHVADDQYVIEGRATHSGHICLGVDGLDTHADMFTQACKRVVAYEREQRKLADAIVTSARKRARDIIAEAETQVDGEEKIYKYDWYGEHVMLHK
jgi:hypothetical protein